MAQVDFEFRQTQWTTNAETLSRIKEDEQKWLFFAFGTLGGLLGIILGGFHGDLDKLTLTYRWGFLLGLGGISQVFAFFWVGQALTLRQQYYRTLIRLLAAQAWIEGRIPAAWVRPDGAPPDSGPRFMRSLTLAILARLWSIDRSAPRSQQHAAIHSAERWRRAATAPSASKRSEILLLVFLLAIALFTVSFVVDPKKGDSGLFYMITGILSVGSLMFWPFIAYPLWDRSKLSMLYWNDIEQLQRFAKPREAGETKPS